MEPDHPAQLRVLTCRDPCSSQADSGFDSRHPLHSRKPRSTGSFRIWALILFEFIDLLVPLACHQSRWSPSGYQHARRVVLAVTTCPFVPDQVLADRLPDHPRTISRSPAPRQGPGVGPGVRRAEDDAPEERNVLWWLTGHLIIGPVGRASPSTTRRGTTAGAEPAQVRTLHRDNVLP